MIRYPFAPGCAHVLYKNELVGKLHYYLLAKYGGVDLLLTCCHHTPRQHRIIAGVSKRKKAT